MCTDGKGCHNHIQGIDSSSKSHQDPEASHKSTKDGLLALDRYPFSYQFFYTYQEVIESQFSLQLVGCCDSRRPSPNNDDCRSFGVRHDALDVWQAMPQMVHRLDMY